MAVRLYVWNKALELWCYNLHYEIVLDYAEKNISSSGTQIKMHMLNVVRSANKKTIL